MTAFIGRREFITLLGGAAAWPLAARAQQTERVRWTGVLMNRAADDPDGQARVAAFQQALQQLGWSDGRNVRVDTRAERRTSSSTSRRSSALD
jgi:putative tryptophan/tyrosine transport system substrate-binding protein